MVGDPDLAHAPFAELLAELEAAGEDAFGQERRVVGPRSLGRSGVGSALKLAFTATFCADIAQWCAPCRHEAPTLAVTAEQYRPDGVAFLGVDVRDDTASALAFGRQFGVPYPSVSDSGSVITLDFTSVVPIAGTPTTLVIDRTGHIAGAVFGPATQQELTDILAQVVHS